MALVVVAALARCAAADHVRGKVYGLSKNFKVRWLDQTTVVVRVRSPINRLARIELSETGAAWKELNHIWTGSDRIEIPSGDGDFQISVRCYPPTGIKGSEDLVYSYHVNLATNTAVPWVTIHQTNRFWKTDALRWRLRVE